MKGVADYAVVYDITSDTERGRVDKVLKGFWVQGYKKASLNAD